MRQPFPIVIKKTKKQFYVIGLGSRQERLEGGEGHEGEGKRGQGGERQPEFGAAATNERKNTVRDV